MKKLTTKRSSAKFWLNRVLTLMISLMVMTSSYSQDRNVSGIVTDEAGIPLPGVNIVQKGTLNGVTTDVNGKFVIRIPGSNTTLIATFIGYKTVETEVDMKNSYAISMAEDVKQVDEVVVVGYGVTKKSDLTGAVASVSGSTLTRTPSLRTDQALQGKAAGVQIISNSGMPTSGISIKVRGVSSITSENNDPIVIIDGIPGSLSTINPNDIESIEVLKDASSQAIYGSSGGNGVILITTKKGKTGKIQTEFTAYRGVQSPWKRMDVMDGREFADFYNKNISAAKKQPNFYSNLDTVPSTNWQDEIFREAIMEDYSMRISGGNEVSTYMVSAGYGNLEGVIKQTYLKRFNFRINSDHKLSKRIRFGENLSGDLRKFKGMLDNNDFTAYLTQAISAIPTNPIKDQNGLFVSRAGGNNPVGRMFYDRFNYNRSSSINANAYVAIDLLKGLTFESRIGGSFGLNEGKTFLPVFTTTDQTWSNSQNFVSNVFDRSFGWTFQNILNYNTTILEDYNLGAMVGVEAKSGTFDYISGKRFDLRFEDEHWQTLDGTTNLLKGETGGNRSESRSDAVFGRLNFNYKGKYLATGSVRRDGSDKFGPDKKYGIFPAFSFGWKFTDEEFLKNQNILTFGKLRYGWGQTGNSNIPSFAYIPLMQSAYTDGYVFGSTYVTGAARFQPANPELAWEAMSSSDFGADLSFFKNKLSISFDIFEKHNDGMIMQSNLLSTVGRYASNPNNEGGDARPLANVGEMSNQGLEFSLGYKENEGEFNYNIDFNITFIKIKIVKITETFRDGKYFVNLFPTSVSEEGQTPYQFYGYKTNGIFTAQDDTFRNVNGQINCGNQPFKIVGGKKVYLQPKAGPGDLRFVDVNGDSILNTEDMTFIGDPNPKFTFGITGDFAYKGFDLSYSIIGSYGNDILNAVKYNTYNNGGTSNWSKDRLNSYRLPTATDQGNTNTSLFRVDPSNLNDNLRLSDWYIEDGSFIRLKSIQIGYTLPESINKKLSISRCRVYVGANNLITLTNYTGMDPEVGSNSRLVSGVDAGVYPQARVFMAGMNFSF